MQTRRDFLKITLGSMLLADVAPLFGAEIRSRTSWKIGITDWDLRATGRLSSFGVAKELGYEGVQVSYQPEGEDSLADKANRSRFLAASKESGVAITSFCIGMLNSRPLATTPEAESWVENCIEAMAEMNVEQVLIPFFGRADLTQNTDHFPIVVEKFKRLARIAERHKKILSIESTLSAEDHLRMIDAVGSGALKVYYDTANGVLYDKHYDIFHEMELLGKHNYISQIHFKENRQRLGEGNVDFTKVCEMLEKINYDNWVVIEGSTTGDWKESQAANARFVKKLFGR
jgi:sugar phosphate isomerase/epimerase